MKKTLTINLNKTVFHIDEDAYDLLQAYLSDVNHHFKSEEEKTEIIADIEARIAELFTQRLDKSKNVITIEDVNAIVEIMGKPDQFSDEEETTEKQSTENNPDEKVFSSSKRFYRDVENGLLSGVCSGLAAYLGWDVTLVRILLVLFVFLGLGSIIPIYLVVWLITPKAETTAQKMAMRGEIVNIETIKNKMNDAKNYIESDKFKESAENAGNKFMHFFQAVFKILITIVGAIFTIVGVVVAGALIFGLIIFLFQPESITTNSPEVLQIMQGISSEKITLLIFSILFIVGCPIFALIYWSMRARSSERAVSNTPFWVALVLWFAGIFMFLSVGSETLKVFKQNVQQLENWDSSGDENNPDWTTETRAITELFYAIDASGVMNVELTYTTDKSVEVATVKNYLSKVKTEVKDGVLRIYSSDLMIKPNVKIRIGLDSLTAISSQGAAKVRFMNAFPTRNLKIDMSGASKGDFNLTNAQTVDVILSGASKLEMAGVADTLKLDASGAAYIDTENLTAKYVQLDMSGAGKADVKATETIRGDVSGVSSVNVKGKPRNRQIETSGTSKIDFDEE